MQTRLPMEVAQIVRSFSQAIAAGDFDDPGQSLQNLLKRPSTRVSEFLSEFYQLNRPENKMLDN